MQVRHSNILTSAVVAMAMLCSGLTQAADTYQMDTKGSHAFIQFKIQHLGFSWLLGRFNTFDGSFVLDESNIEKSKVNVSIDVASVDSNHAERDKHLRGADFFNVAKFPKASFVSTSVKKTGEKTAKITGDFTLKGITKPVTLDVKYIGGGKDPWGGYRQGFEATTQLRLKDFGIDYNLGPASEVVDIYISAEGIKQ
jgi:polyisoprenoid-binding protein YceI